MAKKIVVELLDDFDGESQAAETVVFGIDSVTYEIDLSMTNAERLRGLFEQWAPHARKLGRAPKSKDVPQPAGRRADTAAIREWARKNGHPIPSRGRLHSDIIRAYQTANA
ncbi:histone-like nucleoid-structuring protein Lsr2 [Nocardia sp. alder85J]|uniref:histone-like nucleoid-structuring protein Lsr2 n=1 Tax=Nocardia sp. alder85J TaxID=2862949 RepID=UPI001CD5858A|nr:Lsr2 family protein [Nocardia sp. alder85J]MCX4097991.1 Lsr2 family protein [Nocardia sp. alder85J]